MPRHLLSGRQVELVAPAAGPAATLISPRPLAAPGSALLLHLMSAVVLPTGLATGGAAERWATAVLDYTAGQLALAAVLLGSESSTWSCKYGILERDAP